MSQFNPAQITSGGMGKLITRYIHSGNIVYQPTAIDMNTGVITFGTPHGFVGGETLMLAFNDDITPDYCPNEWFSTPDYLQVSSIVSPTEIILKKSGGSVLTSYATKVTVDMSKIHFENTHGQIIINGFSVTKLKMRTIANTGSGDCYAYLPELNDGQTWQTANAYISSYGFAGSSNATHALYRHYLSEMVFQVENDGHATYHVEHKQWTIDGSTPTIKDNSILYTGWGSTKTKLSSNFITTIAINGRDANLQYWLNGSICELYDLS